MLGQRTLLKLLSFFSVAQLLEIAQRMAVCTAESVVFRYLLSSRTRLLYFGTLLLFFPVLVFPIPGAVEIRCLFGRYRDKTVTRWRFLFQQ